MLNQVVLVGRINGEPIKKVEGEKVAVKMTLCIPRSFKNEEGEYENDFIPVVLWNMIAENVLEYCKNGDLVGVKGRLQSDNNGFELIAEKITFLSSKAQD